MKSSHLTHRDLNSSKEGNKLMDHLRSFSIFQICKEPSMGALQGKRTRPTIISSTPDVKHKKRKTILSTSSIKKI